MKDEMGTFNVLASIEKHIEALKPLLPKQALICIGEYPIKTVLKEPSLKELTSPILVEKSSEEIYKWLPKNYDTQLVLGFEDSHIDTHFWYSVLPTVSRGNSVVESLSKKSVEKLHGAIIFSSIWDGIGSAALPVLIGKLKAANLDSLSIAVLPSKVQPIDSHFNAYAALKMCSETDGATVLLMERDSIEGYEGVDRKGDLLKGNLVADYLLNLFLSKDTLVEEISELSRTFNTKMFTPIVVTGASYKIYGSLENMLNTALLKPFLTFDLSSVSLLYVVLRLPLTLKDKLPRGKIELALTNWFKQKTSLQSIYISEPVYTEEMNERIDAVLFVGGFEMSGMMSDLEAKVQSLKSQAVERGLMTDDWRVEFQIEEPPKVELPQMEEPPIMPEMTEIMQPPNVEEPQVAAQASIAEAPPTPIATAEPSGSTIEEPKEPQAPIAQEPETTSATEVAAEEIKLPEEAPTTPDIDWPKPVEEPQAPIKPEKISEEPKAAKPKRTPRTKKPVSKKKTRNEKVDKQKEQTSA